MSKKKFDKLLLSVTLKVLLCVTLFFLIIAMVIKGFNSKQEDEINKMAINDYNKIEYSENIQYTNNPYIILKESNKGNYLNTDIDFLKTKNQLYTAQNLLDKNKYDLALIELDKIKDPVFNSFVFDLKGDIFTQQKNYNKAVYFYQKAFVSSQNKFFKDAVFNKMNYVKQKRN